MKSMKIGTEESQGQSQKNPKQQQQQHKPTKKPVLVY